MKRFWDWLFPKPKNLVYPFAHVWAELEAVITEHRPDLLSDFHLFGVRSPSALALWLDEHFPLEDMRWGLTSVGAAPRNLRRYLEHAK